MYKTGYLDMYGAEGKGYKYTHKSNNQQMSQDAHVSDKLPSANEFKLREKCIKRMLNRSASEGKGLNEHLRKGKVKH